MLLAWLFNVALLRTAISCSELALSSRNRRLSHAARVRAAQFPLILRSARTTEVAADTLKAAGFGVDYVEDRDGVRLGAVRIENVRLIDNVRL